MSVRIESPRDLVQHARHAPSDIQTFIRNKRPTAEFTMEVLRDLRLQVHFESNANLQQQLTAGVRALEDWFQFQMHQEQLEGAREASKLQHLIQQQQENLAVRAEKLAGRGLIIATLAAFFALAQIGVAGWQVWLMLQGA